MKISNKRKPFEEIIACLSKFSNSNTASLYPVYYICYSTHDTPMHHSRAQTMVLMANNTMDLIFNVCYLL